MVALVLGFVRSSNLFRLIILAFELLPSYFRTKMSSNKCGSDRNRNNGRDNGPSPVVSRGANGPLPVVSHRDNSVNVSSTNHSSGPTSDVIPVRATTRIVTNVARMQNLEQLPSPPGIAVTLYRPRMFSNTRNLMSMTTSHNHLSSSPYVASSPAPAPTNPYKKITPKMKSPPKNNAVLKRPTVNFNLLNTTPSVSTVAAKLPKAATPSANSKRPSDKTVPSARSPATAASHLSDEELHEQHQIEVAIAEQETSQDAEDAGLLPDPTHDEVTEYLKDMEEQLPKENNRKAGKRKSLTSYISLTYVPKNVVPKNVVEKKVPQSKHVRESKPKNVQQSKPKKVKEKQVRR